MLDNFDVYKASQRFIEIRTNAGKTQEQLAEDLGVNSQTIKNYEKAGSPNAQSTSSNSRVNAIAGMKIETLYKLAKLFNVSADYLLCLTDDPERLPAATDDLGLSAAAIKKIQCLKMCSSDDSQYMAFLSQLFENPAFECFFRLLYFDCQAVVAETIYSSVPIHFDPSNPNEANVRYSKILEIANSGKYNSAISGFLTQMVRFDQEQTSIDENDCYFPYGCDFAHDLIPEITEKRVKDCFDSYLRSLCQEATRVVEKQLREEASTDGND